MVTQEMRTTYLSDMESIVLEEFVQSLLDGCLFARQTLLQLIEDYALVPQYF